MLFFSDDNIAMSYIALLQWWDKLSKCFAEERILFDKFGNCLPKKNKPYFINAQRFSFQTILICIVYNKICSNDRGLKYRYLFFVFLGNM